MITMSREHLLNAEVYFVPDGEIAGGTKASGTLTLTENVTADDTVTIGAKTYTFKAAVGATADEVTIGADAAATLDNLIAAINGTAGAGGTYGANTVPHTQVTAAAGAGDTMTVTATTAGTAGNAIATTETFTGAGNVFGAATLAGGVSGDTIGLDTKPVDFTGWKFGCLNQVEPQTETKSEDRECSKGLQGGFRVKKRQWVTRDMAQVTTLEFNQLHHRLAYGLSEDPTPGTEQTPFEETFREITGWMRTEQNKEEGGPFLDMEIRATLRLPSTPAIKNETASPVWEFEYVGDDGGGLETILFYPPGASARA
ncbi:hypothetical protein [Haloferula sargassicola]|uniref:Uncharacterized protein n=1 Tax=Haloferula sargassicola TaxID=490096 RepID=A0ABP9UPW5_9BACT